MVLDNSFAAFAVKASTAGTGVQSHTRNNVPLIVWIKYEYTKSPSIWNRAVVVIKIKEECQITVAITWSVRRK